MAKSLRRTFGSKRQSCPQALTQFSICNSSAHASKDLVKSTSHFQALLKRYVSRIKTSSLVVHDAHYLLVLKSHVYSKSGVFGHLVDVEHIVSRRLLTNATGAMVCKDVTSLMVPKPF